MARSGRSYPSVPALFGHAALAPVPVPAPPSVIPISFLAWPPMPAWATGELQGQWVAGAPYPQDFPAEPRTAP